MGKIIFNDEPYGSSYNNAKNISYDNTDSGLSATTVKDAIDELNSTILEKVYPVGSIYMSTVNTNPETLFGGTWESFGEGRTLIGVNANDTDFNTVEKTGGEKMHALTTDELASHTHTFTGGAVTSESGGVAHTHSISHTHTTPSTNTKNGGVDHNHTFSGTSSWATLQGGFWNFCIQSDEDIGRNGVFSAYSAAAGNYRYGGGSTGRSDAYDTVWMDVSHNHTYSGTTSKSSAYSHAHTLPAMTTNSISTSTSGAASATSHTHSVTAKGTNSNTGSGAAHNNLQPYITCYMWKRIA